MTDKIKVLDQGYVELIDFMPDSSRGIPGDLAIVRAARKSYMSDTKSDTENKKLLGFLYTRGHMTPFEHVIFTFNVRAPLVVWWQWVRHRTQSYNAQSGRYVPFKLEDFHIPSRWRLQKSDGLVSDSDCNQLTRELVGHYTQSFLLYEEALARGVACEQARFFLPAFTLYYTFQVTVNARNLMLFLKQRLDSHAQYEIRVYAQTIMQIFEQRLPWTAACFKDDIYG